MNNMLIALTGTPGVGKTTIATQFKQRGITTINIIDLAINKKLTQAFDDERDSYIIDTDKLNEYIHQNYSTSSQPVILDGHLSHLLPAVDRVIILRCHPQELRKRLAQKNWKQQKQEENIEAEILDIILCETAKHHKEKNLFEIDTTHKSSEEVTRDVLNIINNNFKNNEYGIGTVDWSQEILNKE